MTTMLAELYDALLSAGADEGKARRAAEVAPEHEQGFDRLERRIDGVERRIDAVESTLGRRIDTLQSTLERRGDALQSELNGKIVELGGRITLIQWMFGLIVGALVALLIKAFA